MQSILSSVKVARASQDLEGHKQKIDEESGRLGQELSAALSMLKESDCAVQRSEDARHALEERLCATQGAAAKLEQDLGSAVLVRLSVYITELPIMQ